jgi:diphosphomevalonate decarboxylase
MGGYVAWRAGNKPDGSDSMAEEVAPASHWPEMRALILIVSAEKKGVASTAGMQTTVQTSTLFPVRASEVVPRRMQAMEAAIASKDFESFAQTTMQDSNSFHAVCLDSWPPIHYLNDVSRAAMNGVETINRRAGKLICAYTFDAGPNAVIYYLEEHSHAVAGVFRCYLQGVSGWEGEYGAGIRVNEMGGFEAKSVMTLKQGVSRVICTGVGGGPAETEKHLVDERGGAVEPQ